MIVEVRSYKLKAGKREEWASFFQADLVPFMEGLGMQIPGYFNSTEDEDTFVWLRAFEDAASRESISKSFYGAPEWEGGFKARAGGLVDSIEVQVMESTGASKL